MKINVTTLLVLFIVFLVGWQMAASRTPPAPAPSPDQVTGRPVVRWVVRTAKSLLWVMAFAEDNPAAKEGEKRPEVDTPMKLVKAPEEGAGRVDWSEGW